MSEGEAMIIMIIIFLSPNSKTNYKDKISGDKSKSLLESLSEAYFPSVDNISSGYTDIKDLYSDYLLQIRRQ
jgi:hypothetical protein